MRHISKASENFWQKPKKAAIVIIAKNKKVSMCKINKE